MANVINEIKNWQLFTEKFGTDYEMHDAVIKQFNLNGNIIYVLQQTERIMQEIDATRMLCQAL